MFSFNLESIFIKFPTRKTLRTYKYVKLVECSNFGMPCTAFRAPTHWVFGNRKLCEMCSICVNKPEMMCRLPADHFRNERKTSKKKKWATRKFGVPEPQLYLYLCIYLFAKRIRVASSCLMLLLCPQTKIAISLVCPLC